MKYFTKVSRAASGGHLGDLIPWGCMRLRVFCDLIDKYRGRYRKGWDQLRAEKLERMQAMGIVPPSQTLPEAVGFDQEGREGFDFKLSVDSCGLPSWGTLSDSDQEELDFRRSLYAAQIEHMDLNVGRVIDDLAERGILDETLILFHQQLEDKETVSDLLESLNLH